MAPPRVCPFIQYCMGGRFFAHTFFASPTFFVRSTKQIGLCGETGYPLCEMSVKNVELSEPKASFRCLVNKHIAGRLGTSALIFFCFVFLYQDKKMKWVWATPKTKHSITHDVGACPMCSSLFCRMQKKCYLCPQKIKYFVHR